MVLEKSCGAIVYTIENGEIKYLIVEEASGSHSFPKGHMENEETEEETALREIREETNLEKMSPHSRDFSQELGDRKS